jgi:5-methylcytosine-specific restriction protein A
MFYDGLNGGRTVLEFEHSLKNCRDAFDSYFDTTKREGWKDKDSNEPAILRGYSSEIFKEFNNKDEDHIWSIISQYVNPNYSIRSKIFDDLIAEDTAGSNYDSTKTEGGIRVRISRTIERNATARQMALDHHGYSCQVCGFDFESVYGKWGLEFAEVHHLIPLAELKGKEQKTDPKKDLAILCANCHRMVHRKKGLTLTLEELRNKLKWKFINN